MIRNIQIDIPTKKEIERAIISLRIAIESNLIRFDNWLFNKLDIRFWKLMYRFTGRCGSLMHGHSPVMGNRKTWLWKTTIRKDKKFKKCVICSQRHTLSNKLIPIYKNYSKMGRQADMENLVEMRKTANDAERVAIDKSMYKINHEEKHVKAMREDLIKATRQHDHDKIKEAHDYVGSHRKYRNE